MGSLLKLIICIIVVGLCVWVYLAWKDLSEGQRLQTKEGFVQGVLGTPLSDAMKERARNFMKETFVSK